MFSRDYLISLCEASVVPEIYWMSGETAEAQMQVGKLLVLLSAGCEYTVLTKSNNGSLVYTNERTIWVEVKYKDYSYFNIDDSKEYDIFYLPTERRLDFLDKLDWSE